MGEWPEQTVLSLVLRRCKRLAKRASSRDQIKWFLALALTTEYNCVAFGFARVRETANQGGREVW